MLCGLNDGTFYTEELFCIENSVLFDTYVVDLPSSILKPINLAICCLAYMRTSAI